MGISNHYYLFYLFCFACCLINFSALRACRPIPDWVWMCGLPQGFCESISAEVDWVECAQDEKCYNKSLEQKKSVFQDNFSSWRRNCDSGWKQCSAVQLVSNLTTHIIKHCLIHITVVDKNVLHIFTVLIGAGHSLMKTINILWFYIYFLCIRYKTDERAHIHIWITENKDCIGGWVYYLFCKGTSLGWQMAVYVVVVVVCIFRGPLSQCCHWTS